MFEFMTIRELYEMVNAKDSMHLDGMDYVQLQGWVRTNRNNGSVGFIALNDGTYFRNCQLVYTPALANFDEISKCLTGAALTVTGKFKLTPEMQQPFELELTEAVVEGICTPDYPLQKKRHSFEYLRDIAHLRPRTNTFSAVFRVRSVLAMALHEFFQDQGFVYVHTPIITGNDAEGAGEVFTVTTRNDGKYDEDFFGKHACLTVSGQLHVEAYALAFRDVYTFGPTFRAENSNTKKHANEFWMCEPEIAFADLEDDMNLMEDMVKYCINYVFENCPEEMKFFNQMIDKTLIERLQHVLATPFVRMEYSEAVERLKAVEDRFENKAFWGMDIQTEHEKYLTEEVCHGPVFVMNYPKEAKVFYMRLNDDNKTVAATDLLMPVVGELCGGSQREERYDVLLERMHEMHVPVESLQWYLDLRKYGCCKHAGFGVGFERLLMYLTGMENIRDVLSYPRTPRNLDF
ncbi:MAG: asparagine--tRNA ligase [Erysipelotrichaceae bacterium]|nr:asparagine--tRNA ligase [Erysipelotrichaceae bacterium]